MVVLSCGDKLVEKKVVFDRFEVEGVEKLFFFLFMVSIAWYRVVLMDLSLGVSKGEFLKF